MPQPVARARVRWRTPQEGGRKSPPPGPVYVPTARFDDAPEIFSVVLRFSTPAPVDGPPVHECELNLLAPDMLPDLAARLAPGSHLMVMEGARVVADCDVLSVRTAEPGQPFANV